MLPLRISKTTGHLQSEHLRHPHLLALRSAPPLFQERDDWCLPCTSCVPSAAQLTLSISSGSWKLGLIDSARLLSNFPNGSKYLLDVFLPKDSSVPRSTKTNTKRNKCNSIDGYGFDGFWFEDARIHEGYTKVELSNYHNQHSQCGLRTVWNPARNKNTWWWHTEDNNWMRTIILNVVPILE